MKYESKWYIILENLCFYHTKFSLKITTTRQIKLDNSEQVKIVFMGFSKAYDWIPHNFFLNSKHLILIK